MGAVIGLATTKLLKQIRVKMVELGINWKPTPQPLHVTMSKDSDGSMARALGQSPNGGAGLLPRARMG
jgi:hypothetical protein